MLDAEGVEIGRVEGYPGRVEWLEAVRDAKAGRRGLADLMKRAKRSPRDLDVQIELAQARLTRGSEEKALATLDTIIARSGAAGTRDAAAHAARVKGRWLLRVKEDGAGAIVHFTAMLQRFAGTPHAAHFRYWAACAHHSIGADSTALGIFEAWAAEEPTSNAPLENEADFMVHFGFPPEASEPVVRAALVRAPESAELHYLLARVSRREGNLAAATEAIARAVVLEPATAIYTNYQRRLAMKGDDTVDATP